MLVYLATTVTYTGKRLTSLTPACLAPFKSAVKNVVKKEKIVGGLLASSRSKKGGKVDKNGKKNSNYLPRCGAATFGQTSAGRTTMGRWSLALRTSF